MQLYPGTDAPAAPPTPTGFGIWPTPDCATGGDKRNAADLEASAQSITDRTNYLFHHSIDPVNGGDYSALTATIATGNAWVFGGVIDFTNGVAFSTGPVISAAPWYIVGGSTLHVGNASSPAGVGHVLIDGTGAGAGSSVAFQNGGILGLSSNSVAQWATGATLSMLSSAGAATFANAVTLSGTVLLSGTTTQSGAYTQTGTFTQSGAGAYQVRRPHTVSTLPATISDARAFDIIYVNTGDDGSTSTPLTLAAPAAGTPLGVCVRVCMPGNNQVTSPSNSFHLTIITSGGGAELTADHGSGTIDNPVWVDFMVAQDKNNSGTLMWAAIAGTFS